MSDTPVTLLARREVAQNRVYRVCFDHIRGASGEEVENFLSVIPQSLGTDLLGGVCVLPIANDKVGLLEVWRHPLGRSGYEIPRGFIDKDETALLAASRELAEETGIQIEAEQLIPLGFFTPEAALLQARVALFAVKIAQPVGAAGDEMGHTGFRWFDECKLHALLARGEIEDPATNIAWLRYTLNRAGAAQGGSHGRID